MKLYRDCSQLLLILLLSATIGMTQNLVRSNSLPWFARKIETAETDSAGLELLSKNPSETASLRSVTLQQAYEIFKQKKATFIDAREPVEYAIGHIPGAVNVPFDFIHQEPYWSLLHQIGFNQPLVVYCPGIECDLALLTAEQLLNQKENPHHRSREEVSVIGWATSDGVNMFLSSLSPRPVHHDQNAD